MKRTLIFALFFIVSFLPFGAVHGESERDKGYFTLLDARGRIVCRTAIQVSVGDEYLDYADRLYRVERIKGDCARVRFVRKESPGSAESRSFFGFAQWFTAFKEFLFGAEETQAAQGGRPIAIYYTHSDESYVPTDGRSSIPANGGVLKVGAAMARRLRWMGVPVLNDTTPHDPHDAMAYDRSRRTAVQLLKRRPVALLDIHRDAVPPQEYRKKIDGAEVTKVRIVIGRQNPNKSANDGFARQIKAAVNRKYPGMIWGIYYGKGTYNQDLAPRTLLLEFGSNTNSRIAAEKGAIIFASAAADVLYNRGRGAYGWPVQSGSYRALIWILGAVVIGGVLFILINGGIGGLRRFGRNIKEEFIGAPGADEGAKNGDQQDEEKI